MDIEKAQVKCGQYTVVRQLGKGYHAKVKLAKDDKDSLVAIKVFKSNHALAANVKALANEINMMKKLNHPNLVNLLEYQEAMPYQRKNGQKENRVCIVLELAQGGELFEYVAQTGRFSEEICRFYFKQLIDALDYLHSQGIAHRDLKPENLLFDAQFNLKLADFGFAQMLQKYQDGKLRSILGTPGYMAPEINAKQPYEGKTVDLFASAVVLFIMFAGSPPFSSAAPNDPYYKLIANNKSEMFWAFHAKHKGNPNFFSEHFKTLLTGLLQNDPAKRWTLEQVRQSEWMNGPTHTLEQIQQQFLKRKQVVDQEIEKERIKKEIERNNRPVAGGRLQQGMGKFRGVDLASIDFQQVEELYNLNTARTVKQFRGAPTMKDYITVLNKDLLFRCLLNFPKRYCTEIITVDQQKYKFAVRIVVEGKPEQTQEFEVELQETDEEFTCVSFNNLAGDRFDFLKNTETIKKLIDDRFKDEEEVQVQG